MANYLIEEAKRDGIKKIHISVIIRNTEGKILLIEDLLREKQIFRLPQTLLKEGETVQQALERSVAEETNMQLRQVMSYIGHYDKEGERTLHFLAEIKDPYSLETNYAKAYAWLESEEAVGYPIRDELRIILNNYIKLKS